MLEAAVTAPYGLHILSQCLGSSTTPQPPRHRHWLAQGWDEVRRRSRCRHLGHAQMADPADAGQHLAAAARSDLRPLPGAGTAAFGPSPSLGQVGTSLWITPGTVTSSVDRLEGSGLIRRLPHPSDGRTVLVEITPEGRQDRRQGGGCLERRACSRPLPLSAHESAQLVRLMNKIRADAGDVVGHRGREPARRRQGTDDRRAGDRCDESALAGPAIGAFAGDFREWLQRTRAELAELLDAGSDFDVRVAKSARITPFALEQRLGALRLAGGHERARRHVLHRAVVIGGALPGRLDRADGLRAR